MVAKKTPAAKPAAAKAAPKAAAAKPAAKVAAPKAAVKAAPAKKAPAAKAAAPKAPAKAAPAKKAPVAKAAAPAVVKPVAERQNKTQILQQIADATELSKKQVQAVLDELTNVIEGHVKKKGIGEFVLPGLLKITTVKKPATKARKGINPFTGEEVTFKAKPASTSVKVRPLKKLKEFAL
ncbi:MAG: integration host factor [Gammaproteobacteria bacterium]|nr:MAG: integration host factor [Gammaproteobacteria bacterium]